MGRQNPRQPGWAPIRAGAAIRNPSAARKLRRNQSAVLRPPKDRLWDPHPGVVFIRQLVPHRATAFVARVFYGEPFAAEATGNQFDFDPSDEERSDWPSRIAYRWGAPGRQKEFWAESSHEPRNPPVGSLEEFLTRRYWGYNGKPGKRTKAYHLTRPDWLVQTARDWGILGDVGEGCDPRIVEAMRETPVSVLFAAGSRSSVSLPERLPV